MAGFLEKLFGVRKKQERVPSVKQVSGYGASAARGQAAVKRRPSLPVQASGLSDLPVPPRNKLGPGRGHRAQPKRPVGQKSGRQ